MRSIDRAVLNRGAGGHPLPPVLGQFANQGVFFRRGEVAMIAGQPGAGKSLFALWHATRWVRDHGLRGLYLSADSSELVQAARALAMVTHDISVPEAEKRLEAGDKVAVKILRYSLAGLRWSFEPDISYDSMNEELEAFNELWGGTPDFVIVDNLTDVDGHSEDEWGTMRRVMKGLTSLARTTGSSVLVLHHTSEDFKDDPCPPRKAIQGKVSQKPGLVVTMGEGWGARKHAAIVKNRWGQSDKSGRTAHELRFNNINMHFG